MILDTDPLGSLSALVDLIGIPVMLGMMVLGIALNALFLKLGLKAVKAEENMNFGAVFLTTIFNALVGWICCIISWFIIKARHKTSLGGAIGAWFLAGLIPFAIILIVVVVAVGGIASLMALLPTA